MWENTKNPRASLSAEQRIAFRRSKIDIKIIKNESSDQGKYDLFQRLNTGGTPATEQEVRNCILIMQNKAMYKWLADSAEVEAFVHTIGLSDRLNEERYDLELVLRFLIFKTIAESDMKELKEKDLATFLTERMIALSENKALDLEKETEIFRLTFALLDSQLGDDAFPKYDSAKKRFTGGFSVSAYEAVAFSIGSKLSKNLKWVPSYNLREKIASLWTEADFKKNTGSGVSSGTRITKMLPFSRKFFS